jgi:hypothetical protein
VALLGEIAAVVELHRALDTDGEETREAAREASHALKKG